MAVTAASFLQQVPAFCGTDEGLINTALAKAETYINRTCWGDTKADEGVTYLAAHFLVLMSRGEGMASGAKTAESEGGLSASYAVPDGAKASVYGSTPYGQQYLELRRTAFPCRCA